MYCKKCDNALADDAVFCPECGTPVEEAQITCPKCGDVLTDDAVFCPKCGSRIKQSKSQSEHSAVSQRRERSKKTIIYYSLSINKITKYSTWNNGVFSILSCVLFISLAFDFDKIRKEHLELILFSKTERLEEYFNIFLSEPNFSIWTGLLFFCCIISFLIEFVLAWLILSAKKRGVLPKGREVISISEYANLVISSFCILITAVVWIWVLI